MRKELKPITVRDTWGTFLAKRLQQIFLGLIYKPVFATIRTSSSEKENAKDTPLRKALRSGQVSFQGDLFRGRFTAEISKELRGMGAVFDKVRQGYRLPSWKLPPEILFIAVRARDEAAKLVQDVYTAIDEIPINVARYVHGLSFEDEAGTVDKLLSKKFKSTVSEIIGVQPEISDRMRGKIKDEYTQNVTRSIKGFSQDETEKLREIVHDHAMAGRPRDELEQKIMTRLKVSSGRARFIAGQETRLFTSKLKEAQYIDVGIDEYRWETVGDDRVRSSHRSLNNTRHTWDHNKDKNPPKSDRGELIHPGEDFGCRCVAVPIVEF